MFLKRWRKLSLFLLALMTMAVWAWGGQRLFRIARKNQEAAWASYERAVDLKKESRIAEAERALLEAVALSVKEEYLFHRALGTHYFKTNEFQKSIDHYETTINLHPLSEPNLLINMAWCHAQIGELNRAVALMQRYKEVYPALFHEQAERFLESLEYGLVGIQTEGEKRVVFVFKVPSDVVFPLSVAGDWNEKGELDDVYGYHFEPVQPNEHGEVQWTADLKVYSDFPYQVMVKDGDGHVIGWTQFRLSSKGQTEFVQIHPQVGKMTFFGLKRHSTLGLRTKAGDGRKRFFIFFMDCGSWWILRSLMERGLAPNHKDILSKGLYAHMWSDPPITSIAIQRLTTFETDLNWWATLKIQLKGIQFLDRFISMPNLQGDSLGARLRAMGRSYVDLTFNEAFVTNPEDKSLELGFLKEEHFHYRFNPTRISISPESVIHKYLDVQKIKKFVEKRQGYGKWLLATQWNDTQKKISTAEKIFFSRDRPDVLLLRLPSVDILSHYFFENTEAYSEPRRLLESFYVFVDDRLGVLRAQMDLDDVLFVISDHGILNHYQHHPTSMVLGEGPGLDGVGAIPKFDLKRFLKLLWGLISKGEVPDSFQRAQL